MKESRALLLAVVVLIGVLAYLAGYKTAPTEVTTTTVTSTKTVTSTVTETKPVTETTTVTKTLTKEKTVTVTNTRTLTTTVTKTVTQRPVTIQLGPAVVGTQHIDIDKELSKIKDKISQESMTCINCHKTFTPGIVADWLRSRHAHVTPAEALKKPELERMISSTPPEKFMEKVVGCYECHGQKPDEHPDTFDHFGFKIHAIVTPRDCATCHRVEVEEYSRSVKANAHYNLVNNPVYMLLVNATTQVCMHGIKAGYEKAKESACFACHGTRVEFKGLREANIGGLKLKLPVYEGWPNHGVGRVNPDGSKGSCSACHPRHSFSIAVARSPYTCAQCHLDPDVPAFDVWKESKHGNIFLAEWKSYDMEAVPWIPGKHFRAPSCSVCHFSLLVDNQGNVIAPRTHDVGSRIWIRIFGVYSHPQPKIGETWKIVNKDGLPLPYSLGDAEPAYKYLIDAEEMQKRRELMIAICSQCHSEVYARDRIRWFESVVNETDKAVKAATLVLVDAWKKGVAKGLPTGDNPFDEYIEKRWIEAWLFSANSIRYGAAMNGPDWTTFKRGWWQLTKTIEEMKTIIDLYERSSK